MRSPLGVGVVKRAGWESGVGIGLARVASGRICRESVGNRASAVRIQKLFSVVNERSFPLFKWFLGSFSPSFGVFCRISGVVLCVRENIFRFFHRMRLTPDGNRI